jgi:hypothetical protein
MVGSEKSGAGSPVLKEFALDVGEVTGTPFFSLLEVPTNKREGVAFDGVGKGLFWTAELLDIPTLMAIPRRKPVINTRRSGDIRDFGFW